jgi:hypothetical protein
MIDDSDELCQREAGETGCFGLVPGRARQLYTQEWFNASECEKGDGPFYCPDCISDAVVRKCTQKKDHFAHRARLSPVIGPNEGELHRQCKNELVRLLRERFPSGNWEVERCIAESPEKRTPELRPDVSGRIDGVPIAIEVQASTLTVGKIVKRATNYTRRGISLMWLVPLREPLGDLAFRPRLYERYLHSMYYGRTYYWWAGQGLVVKPVHYGQEMRHIELRDWYDDSGDYHQGGGYDKAYRIIKKPVYGRDVHIAEDFLRQRRLEFTPENERQAVPECLIWRDRIDKWWDDGIRRDTGIDNIKP